MTTSTVEMVVPEAVGVTVTDDTLQVDLSDGRTIMVPLHWFPRLVNGTPSERAAWRLIGGGEGIRWDALDEDIGVAGLLAGQPSGESQKSFQRWLDERRSSR